MISYERRLEEANSNLYGILDGDPSVLKLEALSTALKKDSSHGGHLELASMIGNFLRN